MATPSTFQAYAAIVLFLALVCPAPATEQIDQSNLPEWDGGWTHVNPTADGQAVMWQTFTPTCTNLTAVEIDILTANPGRGDDVLTVAIVAAGVVLASAERSVDDGFDGLLRFEFPEAVPLVPEQLYELKVHDTGKGQFGWKYGPNTYEQGSRYVFAQQQLGSDWFFRTYAWVESAAAKYSGGTGEPNDPYQIATAADLIALGETPEDYDKHFILTADIDLDPNLPGGRVFDRAVIAPDTDDSEYWYQGTPFIGVFDGGGRTILHLTISGKDYLGFFGQLGSWDAPACEVKDLGLVHVNISGSGVCVGGLVGLNSGGSIANCHNGGFVHGYSSLGGLVGENGGTIATSHSTASVSGNSDVGGLVGRNSDNILMSWTSALVSGKYGVGGLVGYNSRTSYISFASVNQCYSTSSVTGTEGSSHVGGLVGRNGSDPDYRGLGRNWGRVSDSYSRGCVSGGSRIGGLVGWNYDGEVVRCYSTGVVGGIGDIGGLVGANQGTISHAIWDVEASGLSGSMAGVGLTTVEMMDPYMLGLNGFAKDPNWVLDAGRDYPRLAWEGTEGQVIPEPAVDWLEGEGTAESAYDINTADQLMLLGKASILWDRHFALGADIDLDPNLPGRRIFGQAVIPAFMGVLDGQGHTISHLAVEGGSNLGLFGQLESGALVQNVGIVDVHIVGTGARVGALVGNNQGTISRCHSTGSVAGWWGVGGLVGWGDLGDSLQGELVQCYSSGLVTGEYSVGGLAGGAERVTNCCSSAVVSGKRGVGGLLGGYRFVSHCYSTGAVSGSEDVGGLVGYDAYCEAEDNIDSYAFACLWDIATSGQATSVVGIGKTTAEMQTPSTFLDVGWDFVDETANGTCDYWQMSPGEYPRLSHPSMPEGLGTAKWPYLIRDAQDLGMVWAEPLAHHRLAQSIDLSGITWSMAVIPRFGGNFDGDGYVISNLHIEGHSYVGLFGELGPTASVFNLGLEAADVSGVGDYVGGLVGCNGGSIIASYGGDIVRGVGQQDSSVGGLVGSNDGSIAMSYSTAWVSGRYKVGGLAGSNQGSITTSCSAGFIGGGHEVGGLVGFNSGNIVASHSTASIGKGRTVGGLVGSNYYHGSIFASYSTGSVSGSSVVGGLVGYNDNGDVTHCRSTGMVKGDDKVGGLVGYNHSGRIGSSLSTASVSATSNVGGLVGYSSGSIYSSYSAGSVSGTEYVGGLVGRNYFGGIASSYSTGSVTGTDWRVGGLVGYRNGGSISSSFWDIETSGQATSDGGTGLTTAEMQAAGTFLDAGWDFVGETANGTDDIWWILEGQDYPRLWWELWIDE